MLPDEIKSAHRGLAELQRLITEGIESGVSQRSLDEVLEIARQQATSR